MPISVPVPAKLAGDVLTATNWNSHIKDNVNKLLERGHRVLTVAQFAVLTSVEDGDEVYLEVDAANGIMWHFRYVLAESTYKWRFLGGPPLSSFVATGETMANTAYVALTAPGPSVTIPRSGDYDVELGFEGGNGAGIMSYDIGGAGAADGDGATGRWPESARREHRKTGLTPVTLTAKYKFLSEQANCSFAKRAMSVRPVRIRHDA